MPKLEELHIKANEILNSVIERSYEVENDERCIQLDVGGLIESTHAEYLTVIKWEIDKLERQQKANSIHPFLKQFDI